MLFFMSLIVFFWFATFDFSLGSEEEIKNAYTPFQVLQNDFSGIKENLKSSVGDIKNLFNQSKDEETGK
jgi:hypothetical protein